MPLRGIVVAYHRVVVAYRRDVVADRRDVVADAGLEMMCGPWRCVPSPGTCGRKVRNLADFSVERIPSPFACLDSSRDHDHENDLQLGLAVAVRSLEQGRSGRSSYSSLL